MDITNKTIFALNSFYLSKLTHLYLANIDIGDEGIIKLSKILPNLKNIFLKGNNKN